MHLWVVDPKGGMEFGPGQSLYQRFEHDPGEATVRLLRDAAAILTSRADRLRGVSRSHTPTVEEPLVLLVIDEIATLTAYSTDRKVRTEIERCSHPNDPNGRTHRTCRSRAYCASTPARLTICA